MLNLCDALEVYCLCSPHVEREEFTASNMFIGKLITSLPVEHNLRLLELFTGKSTDDLIVLDAEKLVDMMVDGLNDVQIVSLYAFCEMLL